MPMRSLTFARSLKLAISLGFSLLLAQSAGAQDKYNIHFRSATFTGQAGQSVTVGLGLDNQPEKVTGFSFGVKHDATKLTLELVTIASGLQAALGAGVEPDSRFFVLDQNPVGGGGFTVAMILSADKASVAIPAGLDHPIFDIKYKIAQAATGTAKVDISGDLSNATRKVDVILDVNNGVAKKPVGAPAPVTSATITISTGPAPFLRGDINQSGRLEVVDAILILDFLFSGATLPAGESSRANCLAAFNFDGSTSDDAQGVEDLSDIDSTDAVALLRYLFLRGPAPPAPFPNCGQPTEPIAAAIECKQFLCK